MVLKKPYAFLIKHFKLIHLILSIPMIYLIIRTGMLTSFFHTYVVSNYYTSIINISGTYINYFMYLSMILIILLALAIYFLMKQKEKDTKLYLFIMIYYLLFFIYITVIIGILENIEAGILNAQTIRIYRDITFIFYLPQFFFAIYSILRGIGFDLKKFNFDEDVKELEITDVDSEEFELTFGKNVYKYERTFHRFIREMRYYILENKVAFIVLVSVVIVIIGTALYLHFGVYNKTFRETQKVSHNHLVVSVEDTVLSDKDQGGNIIDGKYYIALALKIKNSSKNSTTLDYDNFELEIQKRRIQTTLDRGNYFIDLGIPYTRSTVIAAGSEDTYVLTYEIDSSLINNAIDLKILDSMTFEIGSITPIYRTIHLSVDKEIDKKEIKTFEMNKALVLSDTRLGMTNVELTNYKVAKSYEYNYQSCVLNHCQNLKNKIVSSSTNYLLILDRKFSLDHYTNYYNARKSDLSFVNDFVKVRYQLEDTSQVSKVKDVTPKELTDEWVIEVPSEVNNASHIDLLVNIRNKIYTLKIK